MARLKSVPSAVKPLTHGKVELRTFGCQAPYSLSKHVSSMITGEITTAMLVGAGRYCSSIRIMFGKEKKIW